MGATSVGGNFWFFVAVFAVWLCFCVQWLLIAWGRRDLVGRWFAAGDRPQPADAPPTAGVRAMRGISRVASALLCLVSVGLLVAFPIRYRFDLGDLLAWLAGAAAVVAWTAFLWRRPVASRP